MRKVFLQPHLNLPNLAFKYFRDGSKWRDIAELNPDYSIFKIDYDNPVELIIDAPTEESTNIESI